MTMTREEAKTMGIELPWFVGRDDFSDIVRQDFENGGAMFYRLTECCKASAKGLERGVGCRKCYRLIDPEFGMAWGEDNMDELVQSLGMSREELLTTKQEVVS